MICLCLTICKATWPRLAPTNIQRNTHTHTFVIACARSAHNYDRMTAWARGGVPINCWNVLDLQDPPGRRASISTWAGAFSHALWSPYIHATLYHPPLWGWGCAVPTMHVYWSKVDQSTICLPMYGAVLETQLEETVKMASPRSKMNTNMHSSINWCTVCVCTVLADWGWKGKKNKQ